MYQALYRKYRPRAFSDVAGQEHITQTLINQITTGRASHAYLFVGTRGTGKTSCAKILARAVNCERPVDGNPCNECATCISIESGQAPDVLEIDAASNNGVDNVRDLRDEAVFSPASTKKRVYIIDEVHMLSGSAFNALLKILEEPPEHLLFILATTELYKVPATVVSRCQRFSFRRLPRDVIRERLLMVADSESLTLSDDAAELLSRLSDGSMRDAISLLDQCAGVPGIDLTRVRDVLGLPAQGEASRLLAAIAARDAKTAFTLLDELYAAGKQPASLFDELCELARDALVAALIPGADNLLSGALSPNDLKLLSKSLPPARLTFILSALTRADFTCGNGDRLAAEICLSSLCDERLDSWPEALVSRIEALESGGFVPQITAAPPGNDEPKPEPEPTPEPESYAPNDFDEPPPWDIPEPVCKPIREPEPKPEPEPEPIPESVTALHTAPTQDSGIWQQILSALPPSLSAAISNTTATLDGGILKISARDTFTLNFLGIEKTASCVREAAAKLLGHDVILRAELGEPSVDAQVKLDDLSQRFGNLMKFE